MFRFIPRPIRLLFFTLLLVAAGASSLFWYTQVRYVANIITPDTIAELPTTKVAIVFGAGVRPDGRPSPMLRERIEAAVHLYEQGKVSTLLMSGDGVSQYYSEPATMARIASELGVPQAAILQDPSGLSTFETCLRAKTEFAINEAILVTQAYHQPRALLLCNQIGITATAYAIPDFELHPELRFPYMVREFFSTQKAWLDLTRHYITSTK